MRGEGRDGCTAGGGDVAARRGTRECQGNAPVDTLPDTGKKYYKIMVTLHTVYVEEPRSPT